MAGTNHAYQSSGHWQQRHTSIHDIHCIHDFHFSIVEQGVLDLEFKQVGCIFLLDTPLHSPCFVDVGNKGNGRVKPRYPWEFLH